MGDGCSLTSYTGQPSMTADTLSEDSTARSSSRSAKHNLEAFQEQGESKQGLPP